MLNEFAYCPRLFYYEWVDGVFVHSADTIEGALRHQTVDVEVAMWATSSLFGRNDPRAAHGHLDARFHEGVTPRGS